MRYSVGMRFRVDITLLLPSWREHFWRREYGGSDVLTSKCAQRLDKVLLVAKFLPSEAPKLRTLHIESGSLCGRNVSE